MSAYPATEAGRDRWIAALRGPREPVRVDRPNAFLLELERFASGEAGSVATVLLANRECPWRCAMCDLWRHTLAESVPPGAVSGQIAYALQRLGPARQVKLYNSGSFFDPRAVPVADHQAIAELVRGFERVVVECHPSLVGPSCLRFAEKLSGQLEVAMGLETVHVGALEKLNKRMTVEGFARAASRLAGDGIAVRAFVIVGGPFQPSDEAVAWACRSVEFARECGCGVVSLILARGGNGAMEALERLGEWEQPRLRDLEQALAYGIGLGGARVFADTWGLRPECGMCGPARIARLNAINLAQTVLPAVECACST